MHGLKSSKDLTALCQSSAHDGLRLRVSGLQTIVAPRRAATMMTGEAAMTTLAVKTTTAGARICDNRARAPCHVAHGVTRDRRTTTTSRPDASRARLSLDVRDLISSASQLRSARVPLRDRSEREGEGEGEGEKEGEKERER